MTCLCFVLPTQLSDNKHAILLLLQVQYHIVHMVHVVYVWVRRGKLKVVRNLRIVTNCYDSLVEIVFHYMAMILATSIILNTKSQVWLLSRIRV